MKKRLFIVNFMLALVLALSFGLTACGDNGNTGNNGGGTHTSHNWSTTYTNDGDRHYQTCDGCNEKRYSNHDYGTNDVCVCGKTKPNEHTSHNWSTTYTNDGDQHYQTCDGCDEKKYSNHDYGTSGVCVCGKQQPDNYVAVTSVTLDKTEITLEIDDKETLTATVLPDNATNKTVTWSSDKPEIADVDDNGTVTAYADGTAIITATADGVKATCTVIVNKATNVFEDIAKVCKTLAEKEGKTNVEILTIFDTDGYLSFAEKDDKGYCSWITEIEIGSTIESIKTVDITALGNSEILFIDSFNRGAYNSDGTAEEQQMVQNMVTKLLGSGCTVIYGTVSATRDSTADEKLGDTAIFTVNALLEKDGKVMEFSDSVRVTKRLGDVYQAVLDSTEANKDNIYKNNGKSPTDLGEVAKLYLAELAKQ